MVVAIGGVLHSTKGSLSDRFLLPPPQHESPSILAKCRPYLRFATPAALYGFNNILFLEALHYTTPALLQVSVLSKVSLELRNGFTLEFRFANSLTGNKFSSH